MANIAQPQVVINYISQRKKIIVNSHNQPSQLIIQTDYNLNETYNFQVINKINQTVKLDSENTTYQLYGTYIDAKKQVHILFYTLGVRPIKDTLSFLVNTYTSEYLAYVKNNRTPIDISIVAKQNVDGSIQSYMVLRDTALANPRGYVEGQAPTDIVYQNIFNSSIPVSGVFGAGNNLNLAQDLDGQEIYTFAFGDSLSTNNVNQFVIGYNNEPDATKAFIVANSGNIFTVDYEGNVEAGDLNVGAISATSITVSGEDLNQVIDDKVEYLSTSIDEKLSATEDWVSDTFETKESVTQTFNELEQDIDGISSFVSGLPTDIALKADQTDLDAISSFVSGLPQDINDISNAMNQKADKEKLNELSGTVEGLAETKADLSALQEVDGKFANYTPTETIVETYATKTSLDDYLPRSEYVDTQYTAGSGLALSGEGLSTFVLTATIPSIEGLATEENLQIVSGAVDDISAFVSGLPDQISTKASQDDLDYVSSFVSGLPTDISTKAAQTDVDYIFSFVSGLPTDIAANTTAIGGVADRVTAIETSGLITSDEVDIKIATATTDMATQTWVEEQGYLTAHQSLDDYYNKTQVDTALALKANAADVYTKDQVDTISGNLHNEITSAVSGMATEEWVENNFLSAIADEYITETELATALEPYAQTTNVTTAITNATSGKADLSTVQAVDDKFANYYTSSQVDQAIATAVEDIPSTVYTGADGIKVEDGVISLTASISDLTNDSEFATSAQVSGIVEGMSSTIIDGLATQNFVTTQGYLTDADLADYALKTDIPSDYTTSGNVSAIVEGMSATIIDGLAKSSDIPTDYTTSGQVSSIVESYGYITGITNNALLSDIPTDDEITGLAKSYVDTLNIATTYATKDELSAKTTSAQVSSIVESYNYITAEDIPTYTGVSGIGITLVDDVYEVAITGEVGKTYSAGTGIGLDETNGKHEFYLTGTVLTGGDHISIENNVVSLTGDVGKTYSGTETGGIEVDNTNNTITLSTTIPTTVAELSDSSNYVLTSDLADYVPTSDIGNYALTSDLQVVSGAVTGVVEDINYLSSVITGKADSSELANYVPTSQLDTLATKDELTAYATDEDIEVVSAAVTGVANDIDYISSIVTGKADSSALADYATTGDVEYLSSVITGKADSSAIPLSTSQLTNDSGYITINDVPPGTLYEAGDGLATSGQNNNIFYLTAAIPTDANISGIASAVVEDLSTTIRSGLASTSDIPTTVAELTDSGDYALKSELIDTEDVSGVVEAMSATIIDGLATEGFVTGQGYITNAALVDYAQLSDLPSDYTTSGQASAIVTGYVSSVSGDIRSGLATTSDISDMATQTWVGQQGFALISQLPTDYTTSAQVSSIVEGYGYITGYNEGTGIKIDNGEVSLTATIPSKISDLTNDSQFATSAQVSSIITGYGYITQGQISAVSQLINDVGYITNNGATNYTAGSGITIDNGVIKTNLVAGSNVTFSVSDNTVTINATGGGGGGGTYLAGEGLALSTNNTFVLTAHIPTTVVELSDSSDYALKSQVPVYNPGTGIAISSNNTINAKLSATGSIALSTLADNTILISGNNSGGGGGNIPTDTSDLTNGAGFITQSAISNKQRVYEYSSGNLGVPDGNQITYNRAYEIFKTTYLTETGYTPLLQFHEVNVPNGSLASNEVATFEEWMYLSGIDVPSSEFALYPDLELIGELPATLEAGKTHVFVRRIIYGSSKQYVSYAYSFGGNE